MHGARRGCRNRRSWTALAVQSFVAKFERGERRIDVAEFIEIARAVDANPTPAILYGSKAFSVAYDSVPPAKF